MKQIKTRKNRNEIYIKKKSFLRCSYTIGFVFRVQCNRFVLNHVFSRLYTRVTLNHY